MCSDGFDPAVLENNDLIGAQEAAEKAAQVASAGASQKRASVLAAADADA